MHVGDSLDEGALLRQVWVATLAEARANKRKTITTILESFVDFKTIVVKTPGTRVRVRRPNVDGAL